MKKNYFILAAIASITLVSCSNEEYFGDPGGLTGEKAISFNYYFQNPTRGETDAQALNNQFIVWGEKNENQSAAGAAPTDGNLVFPNYIVNYISSSAYTTTSNTNGWEYVGFKFDDTNTGSYSTNVTPNTKPNEGEAPAQTIKYWDDNATSYTFTAVSALPADISAGRVKIAKNQTGTNNVYEKGYTITLAKDNQQTPVYPSLTNLYFADRINIAKGEGYSHNAVQFNFRNSLSQVRAGIYETVPGYNISSIKFYVNNTEATPSQTVEAKVSETSAFGAVCDNSTAGDFEGTITVTYYSTGTDVNKPILAVTPNNDIKKSNLILGTNLSTISTSSLLSETASAPSWDQANGDYTAVLPQTTNNPLKLKCDYTLYNPTTKETINITGKTAEIPAQYLQWKANYKYSYIFKITDSNLNPITFDAVVVTNEMGNAEYITTVTEPSITTFGVNSTTGAYVTGGNEYVPGSDIYATIWQNTAVVTPVLSGESSNTKIYKVTSSNETTYPITEASVAEAIAHPAMIATEVTIYTYSNNAYTEVTDAANLTEGTTYYKKDSQNRNPGTDGYEQTVAVAGTDYRVAPKISASNITTDASTYFTAVPASVTTVPAEDGTTKNINALKLTGVKAGTYAIEYTYTVSSESKKAYKVIKVVE